MILKCNNLTVTFGEIKAINNLSFEVDEGEIFGIAGPNGAGKTTLFNLITGFCSGSGELYFVGEKINNLPTHKIVNAGISRTLQVPQLFESLNVYDNIKVGAIFGYPDPKDLGKIIDSSIKVIGLNGKENNIAANLNLLDKKKTMMAAAIATNPKILLLDEPMAGLNAEEINEMITLIQHLNDNLKLTIIIIEHFMRALTQLSDRLMIIEYGEMICCDVPQSVMKNQKVIESYLGDGYA